MNNQINSLINKIYPSLSEKSRREIDALCETYEVKEFTTFVQIGKKDIHEYFLIDGIARSYLMNQEGELITLLFFEEGSVLSPYVTRTQNQKSLINLEAISDCTLLRIEATKFEKLIEENLEIREFANTVLREELSKKINKEIQLISWTSKMRLEHFRKEYSMLENRVPHGMIASYLGITTVSLSRLRSQH